MHGSDRGPCLSSLAKLFALYSTVMVDTSESSKSLLLSAVCRHFKMIWGFASEEDISN